MKKPGRPRRLKELSWDEIGFILEGLVIAPRPMKGITRDITAEYSLGPRGAWIVVLISIGEVLFPLDLTKVFQIGRSLISAELTRLSDAGLIAYEKDASDGRRVALTLTPLGETIQRRVKADLAKMVTRRLESYTRDQVLLFGRMLHDIGTATPSRVKTVPQHRRGSVQSIIKRQSGK
jgi:DNA-binding MarR family transcriptional regulator